jgi:lysophospholipase L1-like esterase
MENVAKWLASPTPAKWLFYGDSITHGALHTFGLRDYTELFAERVRFELGRGLDVVINTAISGHNTRLLLEQYDWRVGQFAPHVVFIMIGMNDCGAGSGISQAEFGANLETLVARIRADGGAAVLQTACPILPGAAPDREPGFGPYMDRVRQVSAGTGVPLVDHERFWREHADQHYYWMSDAFHPNEYGHRAFAQLLFQALGIDDPASPCCRLFRP